ncbi:DEAD/DEAH box helicase family protein [Agrococcus sp. ARC_14]|uniref:restriction endonuclease n=1 Tax=Agrococcus sp. ARC_14 TaxID=2919927 RepID=UPI0032197359
MLARRSGQIDVGDVSDLGIGNRRKLDDETILENLHAVQAATGLLPEASLQSMNFTVEMETGTGKTYVYLRTIYELHQLYGFTKFVIVVPSVAIKEGVETSIRQLRDHFAALYGNPPVEHFQYDSTNLSRVRSFAVADSIQIMIVTVAAINKATNNIRKPSEALGGEKAIDLIRATRPFLIIDEPQSVYGDAGFGKKKGAGRTALEEFGAIASVRYSATHPKSDKANLVFALDSIAAHDNQLVKQIEVDALETEASGTRAYVKLDSTSRRSGAISAKVRVDTESGGSTTRTVKTVTVGDNLADVTGLERYRAYDVENIRFGDDGWIQLTTLAEPLGVGEVSGDDLAPIERTREMIARTIRRHLDKELAVAERAGRGAEKVKVLSLFFIDHVANYRRYDSDGVEQPGDYARIFEDQYAKLVTEQKYQVLRSGLTPEETARAAHQGYFSIDRSKKVGDRLIDTSETTEKGRQAAGLAYEQIMRDKEGLTTPGTPIRFVFTHSALQEGWDNPNVFQICVLRNTGTERWRRQSVGRGLRLAVNGAGERERDRSINRLTVIAHEDFATFAEGLQKELAEELGLTFGIVTAAGISTIQYTADVDGRPTATPIGADAAGALVDALESDGYVDSKGVVQDSLRALVANDPERLRSIIAAAVPAAAVQAVVHAVRRLARPIDIRPARTHRSVKASQSQLQSPQFAELWSRIRHRTVYELDIKQEQLEQELTGAVVGMPPVPTRKATWVSTIVRVGHDGVSGFDGEASRAKVNYADAEDLPDILSLLADRTQLTRATLARVLANSGRLDGFKRNPQKFIDQVTSVLLGAMQQLLVAGVKYTRIPADRPDAERSYAQEIFTERELSGYVGSGGNIVADADGEPLHFSKSVYEHVVTDSAVEREFARQLQQHESVQLFVKLPASFTVPTPLGSYNPDWAAVVADGEAETVYFVAETKGTTDLSALRPSEQRKIMAAREHFTAIRASDARVDLIYTQTPVVTIEDLFAQVPSDGWRA